MTALGSAPAPRSVLHIGTVPAALSALPSAMRAEAPICVALDAVASAQPATRFELVVLGADVRGVDAGRQRAALHLALQQLAPGGRLAVLHGAGDAVPVAELAAADLQPTEQEAIGELLCSWFRRGDRTTVHDLVFEARATLQRVQPDELARRLLATDPPLVVDTRTPSDRSRFGTIEGAVHLPRTVLEWRLDPANGYLHPAVTGFQQHVVIVCNHGYSSSVAAANLQRLGYPNVTDLIGGMAAWRAAGLPVVPPDHTFLEL